MTVSSQPAYTDYRTIVDNYSSPIAVFEETLELAYANKQFHAIFSQSIDALIDLLPRLSAEPLEQVLAYDADSETWRGEVEHYNVRLAYNLKISRLKNSAKPRFIAMFEHKPMTVIENPHEHAQQDLLTELPNRYSFLDQLHQRIERADEGAGFAVLYLDLDHFKDINELHGHHTGDGLLKLCATKIRQMLRHHDVLARLSGDEFAAIVEYSEGYEMQFLLHRIMRYFERPLFLGGERYQLTVSIGMVFYPEQGETAQDLLLNAEKAMYAAKRSGRAQFQLFDRKQSLKVEKMQRIAESMRHVLANEQEQIHAAYQPLYHLQTGEFVGVEVLARWQSPEFGMVSPGEFIPLAESRGLINQLSCRIFEVIKTELLSTRLPDSVVHPLLAINVSAQQIGDTLFEEKLLDFHNSVAAAGWQLEVEMTETQLMTLSDDVIARLDSWQKAGMRIAIDDFGTGYSCLAYLHMLPVNKLKIDRQFLQSQTQSRKEDEIMYAIMSMAKALNIEVLAEGIETDEQFQRLQQLGCASGQGFGLARPQAWDPTLLLPLTNAQCADL